MHDDDGLSVFHEPLLGRRSGGIMKITSAVMAERAGFSRLMLIRVAVAYS
jgi:hypothetical protein